ncbi:DNA polymerase III subunit gamma/tau [Aquabacterium sp.]|uniref:DNA polymerase III subunit gamma/tau n=1 Tax=Aquabacterium sp. TaxID=1872578 RepID=UPI00198751FC|nr:DNA polymerase III subunit gamma/tau [Aquabacterium sp.]MBC7701650.1 DNA polymerase III subunit gamma/tau [Aquabacterium sp.]
MSSMVLARKYRPHSFEAMVGQGHVVQALSNALTQQRLHHAYLFTGTRGVGKTTVSRILAKSLNCVGLDGRGGITARPCGQCQPCCDIDSGRFVDYVELDAASNRGVDEISQLLDQSVYKPVVGRFKVYMIDEVHMLTNHAFNAMLKTLEEPPDYLKFVLATTDPQKVPVTVLSRCLQFNLRPMAMQTVQDHLQQVMASEAISAEPGALSLLARAARGSMRDALSLTDQAIAFGGGALLEVNVRLMLGAVDRQHIQKIIESVSASDGAGLVAAVDTLRELGLSASGTLEELATALQRMAVIQAVPQAVDGSDPDAALWQSLAALLAPDETQLFYSLALQGRAELALAPDEYSGLLMLLLRLLAFKPTQAVQHVGDRAPPSPKAEGSGAANRLAPELTVQKAAKAVAARPIAQPVAPKLVSAPVPKVSQGIPPWEVLPDQAYEAGNAEPDSPPVEAPSPSLAEPPAPPEQPVVAALPDDPLSARWAQLVAQMAARNSITALVRELAMQAQCLATIEEAGGSRWQLRVERESLRGEMHRERLAQALSQLLEHTAVIELEGGAAVNTPAQRDQATRERRQRAAEDLIQRDPLVISVLAQYPGARIVAGSIRPL